MQPVHVYTDNPKELIKAMAEMKWFTIQALITDQRHMVSQGELYVESKRAPQRHLSNLVSQKDGGTKPWRAIVFHGAFLINSLMV